MSDADVRWLQRLDSYRRALTQLRSAVALRAARGLSELEQYGLIRVFKCTHELALNLMKDYLRTVSGADVTGSRDATQAAFAAGLVGDTEGWMEMIASRRLSSYAYHMPTAASLVNRIADNYVALFDALEGALAQRANPLNA